MEIQVEDAGLGSQFVFCSCGGGRSWVWGCPFQSVHVGGKGTATYLALNQDPFVFWKRSESIIIGFNGLLLGLALAWYGIPQTLF